MKISARDHATVLIDIEELASQRGSRAGSVSHEKKIRVLREPLNHRRQKKTINFLQHVRLLRLIVLFRILTNAA